MYALMMVGPPFLPFLKRCPGILTPASVARNLSTSTKRCCKCGQRAELVHQLHFWPAGLGGWAAGWGGGLPGGGAGQGGAEQGEILLKTFLVTYFL